jgi:hypothetical protein
MVLVLNASLALSRGDGGTPLAVGGALLLGAVLWLIAWRLRACVWTTDDAVHRRGLVGRTRVVPREAVASVLWLPGFIARGGGATGLLVLLDAERLPLLRLDGEWWGADRLDRLAGAVGAPVTKVGDSLTPADLAWRNLYELPWRHQHPTLFGLAVTGGVLAITTLGLLVAHAAGWN